MGGAQTKLSPEALPGGGEVSASGLMFWIARAGGQKVTIRTAQRGSSRAVPRRGQKICTPCNFFRNRGAPRLLHLQAKEKDVAKPPGTPPHTDLEGNDRDERGYVDAAAATDQDGSDLKLARDEAKARPRQSDDESGDDRSR